MKHIVLFGGSFNPVHKGHIGIAKQALIQRKADEVWFVLNQSSPFKEKGTTYPDRLKMLEIMLKPYSKHLKVSRIDETLPSPSYAISTVEALNTGPIKVKYDWLIGSDQIPKLNQWHRFDEFKDMVNFVVYERDENEHEYAKLEGETIHVSSTSIRLGHSTETNPKVLNFMMTQGLYLNEMVKSRLSEARYQHTLRVCDLALELAIKHRVDVKRVYLAAMFHDYYKEDTSDAIFENKDLPKAFDHAIAASSMLAKRYYVRDKQVLSAIRNHVSGTGTNKIAQILYIADKCESGRGYDSSALIDLAMSNLNEGFKAVKKAQDAYLRKEDK